MKQLCAFLLSLVAFNCSYGQTNYKETKSLTIQTDAFDVLAKGFSLWGNYTANYNRIFVAGGRNELPDFLNPQKDDFLETRKYFLQIGYYRFFKKIDGLFVGAESIYQNMEITAKSTSEKQKSAVLRVAPVIGYEWTPLKNKVPKLTITPWISERFPVVSDKVSFMNTSKTYQTANFNFVMGLNLGYRFGL